MANQFSHGYALLIGVNENKVPKWALPDVAKDISALQEVLTHPDRCAYPTEQVKTLTGAAATRDGILEGLEWLHERVQADPEATAVIYYSGHGWRSAAGEFYLIPYNVAEGQVAPRALRGADFAAGVGALCPPRLLAVLDCCHAAGMGVKGLDDGLVGAAMPPALLMGGEKGAAGVKGLEALAQGRGRAVLSSSSGEQESYMRSDGKMSVFTYHLLEALTGHAEPKEGAKEVLVSDVMGHVTRRVPETVQKEQGKAQTPDFQVSGNFAVALLLGGQGLRKGIRPPDPLAETPAAAGPAGGLLVEGDLSNTGNLVVGGQVIHGDWVQGSKFEMIQRQLNPTSATPPAPPTHFVGRQTELTDLTETLRSHAQGTIALVGMGGIGKTALAAQLAVQLKEEFPGGVFWADLSAHRGNVISILDLWTRVCGEDEATLPVEPLARAETVRGFLQDRSAKQGPLLMVWDDVQETWRDQVAILKEARPAGVPLLVTSRSDDLALELEKMIRLEELPEDSAVELLSRFGAQLVRQQEADAARIVRLVGCLPLALELAGRLIQRFAQKPGWRLADLCEQLRKKPGWRATFDLSYRLLTAEQQRLFRLLGVFAPVPLLAEYPAALLEWPLEKAEQTMDELVGLSMLRWDRNLIEARGEPRYVLHPLLHEFAASQYSSTESAEFHRQIEASLVRLTRGSAEEIIIAGACLVAMQEPIAAVRSAVLGSLYRLVCDRRFAKRARRAAALILVRLRWLDDVQLVSESVEQIVQCIELVGSYLALPGDRHYLIQKITSILDEKSFPLSDLYKARLYTYRALSYAQVNDWAPTERDYMCAKRLIPEPATKEFQRVAAQVALGRANLLVIQAEETEQDIDPGPMLTEAIGLFLQAIADAESYARDISLLVTIYGQLCEACVTLEKWQEGKMAYQSALRLLDDAERETYGHEDYVSDRAWVLETASDMHLKQATSSGDESHSQCQEALNLARQEIDLLLSTWREFQDVGLAYACITAGDSCWALADKSKACEYWQSAYRVAKSLELDAEGLLQESAFYAGAPGVRLFCAEKGFTFDER